MVVVQPLKVLDRLRGDLIALGAGLCRPAAFKPAPRVAAKATNTIVLIAKATMSSTTVKPSQPSPELGVIGCGPSIQRRFMGLASAILRLP
jgi:hypothetical protein